MGTTSSAAIAPGGKYWWSEELIISGPPAKAINRNENGAMVTRYMGKLATAYQPERQQKQTSNRSHSR
jgi:hypothetical protein